MFFKLKKESMLDKKKQIIKVSMIKKTPLYTSILESDFFMQKNLTFNKNKRNYFKKSKLTAFYATN